MYDLLRTDDRIRSMQYLYECTFALTVVLPYAAKLYTIVVILSVTPININRLEAQISVRAKRRFATLSKVNKYQIQVYN